MYKLLFQFSSGVLAAMILFLLCSQPGWAQQPAEPASPDVVEAQAAEGPALQEQDDNQRRELPIDFRGRSHSGAVVPIAGMFFVFGLPAVIVALALYLAYRRSRLRHETLLALAERGVDISKVGLIDLASREKDPITDLRTGLILVAAGIGIAVMLVTLDLSQVSGVGAIPGLIGLAYLGVFAVRRKGHRSNES